jgi:hypothetical protein
MFVQLICKAYPVLSLLFVENTAESPSLLVKSHDTAAPGKGEDLPQMYVAGNMSCNSKSGEDQLKRNMSCLIRRVLDTSLIIFLF